MRGVIAPSALESTISPSSASRPNLARWTLSLEDLSACPPTGPALGLEHDCEMGQKLTGEISDFHNMEQVWKPLPDQHCQNKPITCYITEREAEELPGNANTITALCSSF